MIYDKSGQELLSIYAVSGSPAILAYDVAGNAVFPDSNELKIMSFNAQGFKGINSQQTMLSTIFSTYNADFIGFQEFCSDGKVPTAAKNTLTAYPYLKLTNHINYNAVASKYQITDWTIADYATQDQYDISTWGETRCYMRGYLNFAGKTIAIFNTHLCVHNAQPRYSQIAELFALAEQEEYCIITGDFNSTDSPLGTSSSDYINEYKLFVDAGYNLANNSPTAGFHNTHTSATSATSYSDLTSALDSIIVSGNISIDSVVFDPTKFSYNNGQKFDHIPVVATLTIN